MAIRMVRLEEKVLGSEVKFHWSAIPSGAFITLGLGVFFLLLGNAVGLSTATLMNMAATSALRFWTWIYFAATLVFSYAVGGVVAGRQSEIKRPGSGALHGMASWGLASIIGFLVGGICSPTFRANLAGAGPNNVNWLLACIVGLGFFGALMGGMLGKEAERYIRVEEQPQAKTGSQVGEVKPREAA